MKYVTFLLLLLMMSCTKTGSDNNKPTVLTLREMGDLATVEYTVTKIIKANDNKTWFKLGDRKILMSCEATIKAGVDLTALTDADFSVNDKTISIQLPPPKVVSLSIPPEKIKVEYQEVGVFRDAFKTNERDQLAAQAEAQIKNSIAELGILEQAKANTSLFVSNFLQQLGYEKVNIRFDKPQSNTIVP